jgi:hypothetical protein
MMVAVGFSPRVTNAGKGCVAERRLNLPCSQHEKYMFDGEFAGLIQASLRDEIRFPSINPWVKTG